MDICNGGVDFNANNLQSIADLMALEPTHAISSNARGPSSSCALPKSTVTPSPDTSLSNVPGIPPSENIGFALTSLVLSMVVGLWLLIV